MPDLLAGTLITALDTPPTVENQQSGSFTFTNTAAWGIGTVGGTYVDCGVAFTAPTTGRVTVDWRGELDNNTAGSWTGLSFVVRTGNVVGSGTTFQAADITRAIIAYNPTHGAFGLSDLVTGLTGGDAYNVRLEHLVGGGGATGTLLRRAVTVTPAT